ncbi:hypothetical protein [Caulobacter vibrioides]|uniref:Uncharacterized protein n=1 Tax=Caulobacter vibrioides (strain NA1000 / CB15N) TaxID=565050 RepID=A0A0H3IZ92_CAUVN|nr:hypothetical protein [Caulobacter vibrioides]YP_009020482.1 hypothetical protein CCNA_03911 [Caulobacter vibrioides NA1000]AHI88513.1 hypothetical protein CCNA_03911 [Caulobacter vibrioides NA1000]AVH77047.1 hypothetical protein CA607_20160 [Caulobacter vibrioides]QXZ52117.1 hypothetical protein KZH45_00105 [Caulobacter vibrioides]
MVERMRAALGERICVRRDASRRKRTRAHQGSRREIRP